jgi:hypothetical protein
VDIVIIRVIKIKFKRQGIRSDDGFAAGGCYSNKKVTGKDDVA